MASKTVTFSGTTKPSGIVDVGQAGTSAVASGVITEGTISSGVNGTVYYAAALDGTPMATSLYTVSNKQGPGSQYYAGSGVAIGFDTLTPASNKGLIVTGCAQNNFEPAILVVTKVGSTYTVVYSSTAAQGPGYGIASLPISVAITFNGTNYVYTPSFNGVVNAAATWIDTAGVLGVPGKYWGAGFTPFWSGGAEYKSNGISQWSATDSGIVVPTNQFFQFMG